MKAMKIDEMIALRESVWNKYTMNDILLRYGIVPNKKGACICPFHNDTNPSLNIKGHFYNCFACGAGGDIFKFVQEMDGITFKEALFLLGDVKEMTFSETVKAKQRKLERDSARRYEENLKYKSKENLLLISAYRNLIHKSDPLSDDWCYYQNKLMYQIYLLEEG